jgi:hypothetical protein
VPVFNKRVVDGAKLPLDVLLIMLMLRMEMKKKTV